MNQFNKDRYKVLLWRIIDDLFWLQTYYNAKENKAEIQALYENYRNHLKDVIKNTEKELEGVKRAIDGGK